MIWIIGNKGMLGGQLSLLLNESSIAHVGTDRELSILDQPSLVSFATSQKPSWIINCAAYTAVDKAEDEPELARTLNVTGPANIASTARACGAALMHISTDYVFDGLGIQGPDGRLRPYAENDPVNPQSVYGTSKADGELAVKQGIANHIIIRTAWLYGQFGPNFVYSMLRLMRQRETLGIVADQFGNPTWAADLAAAILRIVQKPQPDWGTFHYSNEGTISWYDFAREIYRLGRESGIIERECQLSALTSDQYPSKVRRPAWSALNKAAITAHFAVSVPYWKTSLAAFMANLAPDWRVNPLIVPVEEK